MTGASLILASASPRRKELLKLIAVIPDKTLAADIDETPHKGELPAALVTRLAKGKAAAIAADHPKSFVLGSDTVVAVGRRILPKPENAAEARGFLKLLSGRSHRVWSGVALATPDGNILTRSVETRVKVRRLDEAAMDEYIASNEWAGKAGAYAIQGLFAKHIVGVIGSYTNIVGLPLYETANLLDGAGWRPKNRSAK